MSCYQLIITITISKKQKVLIEKKKPLIAMLNPFPSKGFPIDEYNRLALDRVKSISALSAHSAVKGLKYDNYNFGKTYIE